MSLLKSNLLQHWKSAIAFVGQVQQQIENDLRIQIDTDAFLFLVWTLVLYTCKVVVNTCAAVAIMLISGAEIILSACLIAIFCLSVHRIVLRVQGHELNIVECTQFVMDSKT